MQKGFLQNEKKKPLSGEDTAKNGKKKGTGNLVA